jgi:hypothetical protein
MSYMQSAISTFRDRMPQISDSELKDIQLAIDHHHRILMGRPTKLIPAKPFDEMSLNELFALVVRCADCGFTLSQALAARAHDRAHYA